VSNKQYVVIASGKDKKFVWIERRRIDGTLISLRNILKGMHKNLMVIDNDGNCYDNVVGQIEGVDQDIYFRTGKVAGYLWIVFDFLFIFSLLMKMKFIKSDAPTQITLHEAKTVVCNAIQSNPRYYTHAAPKTITGRVRAAKTFDLLIAAIGRD
jgi:hypothetical protein